MHKIDLENTRLDMKNTKKGDKSKKKQMSRIQKNLEHNKTDNKEHEKHT